VVSVTGFNFGQLVVCGLPKVYFTTSQAAAAKRLEAGLTQENLAASLGINARTLKGWEQE
jgi:DNA-binding transcriptional regulator YiaG